MTRFLEVYNLVKNSKLSNPFTDREIYPLPHLLFLLKPRPFLAHGHIMRRFGLFVRGLG